MLITLSALAMPSTSIKSTGIYHISMPSLLLLLLCLICVECCDGGLDPEWYIAPKDRLYFQGLRLLVSEQMLQYSSIKMRFTGNECFQVWYWRTKRQRNKSSNSVSSSSVFTTGVNIDNFKKVTYAGRHVTT